MSQNPINSIIKLLGIWPQCSNTIIKKMVEQVHGQTMKLTEIQEIRELSGTDNPEFAKYGRVVVEWALANQLGKHGYRGRTVDQFVAGCLEQCQRMIPGNFSAVLVRDWVDELYDSWECYASQPLKFRVFAADKSSELREVINARS